MVHISDDSFSIDKIMSLFEGIDTNFVLSGTWSDKKIPWKIWLHEPDDTLKPAEWLLSMGSARYHLRQSSQWEQDAVTKSWSQAKSTWRLRAMDGRWIPALRDLGADLTID
jgi:hypothetical protein